MILCSDFDGTLYPHDETEIFLTNLQKVQGFRAAGNQFCLATGRSLSSLKRAWPTYQDYLDGMLLDNGSVCINSNNEIIFQYNIPKTVVDNVITFINQVDPDGSRTQFVFYYDLTEHANPNGAVTKVRCWISGEDFAKTVFSDFKKNFHHQTQAFLAEHAFPPNYSWASKVEGLTSFIDIVDKEAGKENGIRDYTKINNIPNSEIITVGDDTNDAIMIQKFNGYVVRKPDSQILDLVSPDHIVNSVGELIQKLL